MYEGVELYKDKEVQGLSYQFLDLRKSIGFYLYDADIADDEKGLNVRFKRMQLFGQRHLLKSNLKSAASKK